MILPISLKHDVVEKLNRNNIAMSMQHHMDCGSRVSNFIYTNESEGVCIVHDYCVVCDHRWIMMVKASKK